MPDPKQHLPKLFQLWFQNSPLPEDQGFQSLWFRSSEDFDEAIRTAFLDLVNKSYEDPEAFSAWTESPEGVLGLMLLWDQFPRNLFRGSALAFRADPLALALAKEAIAKGFDKALPAMARLFIYLPFEHSESMDDQDQAVALFEALLEERKLKKDSEDESSGPPLQAFEDFLDYAHRHRDVIKEFGRFPHRNKALSRVSSREEEAYLKAGGGF